MSACVVERASQVTATRWLMPSGRRRDRRSACFAGRRDVRRLICMWLLMMKRRRLHTCWTASCVQTSSQLGRWAGQTTIRVRRFINVAGQSAVAHRRTTEPPQRALLSRDGRLWCLRQLVQTYWPAECTEQAAGCAEDDERLLQMNWLLVHAIGLHSGFRPCEWLNETGLYILKHSLVHNNSTCNYNVILM